MCRFLHLALLAAMATTAVAQPAPDAPGPAVRLYTLDCGRIDFTDMANFSDTGDHDGEHGAMPVPCFLIKHGTAWMLWDAGLGDEIAATPAGRDLCRRIRWRAAVVPISPHAGAPRRGTAPNVVHRRKRRVVRGPYSTRPLGMARVAQRTARCARRADVAGAARLAVRGWGGRADLCGDAIGFAPRDP